MAGLYDAAYMDRRAMMYMRQWITNSIGNIGAVEGPIMAQMHRRMQWCGIVEDCDNDTVEMTPLGMYIVERLNEFSFNFFTMQSILDIWPIAWLQEAKEQSHKLREMPSRHTIINFLAIFQLEFPLDQSLKDYMKDRTAAGEDKWKFWPTVDGITLADQFVDWPELSVDFTKASDVAGDFDDAREMSTGDLSQYLQAHRGASTTVEPLIGEAGDPCGVCDGSGVDPFDDRAVCPHCKGTCVEPGSEPDAGQGPDEQAGDVDFGMDDEDEGFSL